MNVQPKYVTIRGFRSTEGKNAVVEGVVRNETETIREFMSRHGLTDSRRFPRVTFQNFSDRTEFYLAS